MRPVRLPLRILFLFALGIPIAAAVSPAPAPHASLPVLLAGPVATTTPPILPLHMVEPGQEVHQWIAREAYRYFTSQIEGAELGSYLVRPGLTPDSPWSDIAASTAQYDGDNSLLEGTRDEDIAGENPSPSGSAHYSFPSLYHFCAGADGNEIYDGYGSWDSALTTAQWYWDSYVVPNFAGNRAAAYYYLGHVAHLLEDMTVPAHTHNDGHPFGEPYESWIGGSGRFQTWYFGCPPLSPDNPAYDWMDPLSVPADLYGAFYRTANYTEDYDSGNVSGDVSNGSPPYDPDDYPSAWHRPSEVSRSGGMSTTELTITGDDLMPYAIRRAADLYRLFYSRVDASDPIVTLTYPLSDNSDDPTVRTSLDPFDLTASASDPESGFLKKGFRFRWSYWTGTGWSSWEDVQPSPTSSTVGFTPPFDDSLYAFSVSGENGGGRTGTSSIKYLRIVPPSPTPSPTPSSTPTETPTPSPSPTPSSTPTETPTPSPSPTPSSTPTETPTPSPSPSPSPTPAPSPSPTATPTPEVPRTVWIVF